MRIWDKILGAKGPVSHHPNVVNRNFVLLGCIVAFLSACERTNFYHGHCIKQCEISGFQLGRTTKNQVLQRLGTPTCVLSYDPNTLYYLSHVVASQALLKTEPLSSKCFALTFSESGNLSKVVLSSKPYPLVCSKESTPLPSEHNEGFWKQVIRSFEGSISETTITPS
jgi:outer membrane protein assembly factor BamE (lipoprotein component of BamABCDE complex)